MKDNERLRPYLEKILDFIYPPVPGRVYPYPGDKEVLGVLFLLVCFLVFAFWGMSGMSVGY